MTRQPGAASSTAPSPSDGGGQCASRLVTASNRAPASQAPNPRARRTAPGLPRWSACHPPRAPRRRRPRSRKPRVRETEPDHDGRDSHRAGRAPPDFTTDRRRDCGLRRGENARRAVALRPSPMLDPRRAPPTRGRPVFRHRIDARASAGEVAEWLKAHAWKVCIRETVSRVRIPLSPPAVPLKSLLLLRFLAST